MKFSYLLVLINFIFVSTLQAVSINYSGNGDSTPYTTYTNIGNIEFSPYNNNYGFTGYVYTYFNNHKCSGTITTSDEHYNSETGALSDLVRRYPTAFNHVCYEISHTCNLPKVLNDTGDKCIDPPASTPINDGVCPSTGDKIEFEGVIVNVGASKEDYPDSGDAVTNVSIWYESSESTWKIQCLQAQNHYVKTFAVSISSKDGMPTNKEDCVGEGVLPLEGIKGQYSWTMGACALVETQPATCDDMLTNDVLNRVKSSCDTLNNNFSVSCVDSSSSSSNFTSNCTPKIVDSRTPCQIQHDLKQSLCSSDQHLVFTCHDDKTTVISSSYSCVDNTSPSVPDTNLDGTLNTSTDGTSTDGTSTDGTSTDGTSTYGTSLGGSVSSSASTDNNKQATPAGGSGGNSLTDDLKKLGESVNDNTDSENNNIDALNRNTDSSNSNTNAINDLSKIIDALTSIFSGSFDISWASVGFDKVKDKYSNIDLGFQTGNCPAISPVSFTLSSGQTYVLFSQDTINVLPMDIIRKIIIFSFVMSGLFLVFRN